MVTCPSCAYYNAHFSICTSGLIMTIDPNAGCISHAEVSAADSPCKQLTPHQYELLKNTDMKMEWDNNGWLTYVGVRGMPRVEPLCEIPREAITFSYYDQLETGRLVYSRNPNSPAILVFTPLLNELGFTVYKQWNAERFPPETDSKRIPAMSVPAHLGTVMEIAHLIISRAKDGQTYNKGAHRSLSVDVISAPPDLQGTRTLWQSRGYPVGDVRLPDGSSTTYFAYRNERTQVVAFVNTAGLVDVNVATLGERLDVPVSTEEEVLGAFRFLNRCILCGLIAPSPFHINSVCEFCLRRASQIVFKPRIKGAKE